jgi:citrate lyase subunit beta/citryl-CoA lyase
MSAPVPGPALLFCPADRPERYAKALAAADLVVIDLEDAVAEPNKSKAREALVRSEVDRGRVVVRVNAADSGHQQADLAAAREFGANVVMLPKTETAHEIEAVAPFAVIALFETPLGVLNAPPLAVHPSVAAVMWGAEDLVAGIGGSSSRSGDGAYRGVAAHARSRVLLAAAAADKVAIDAVYLAIDDPDGLAREAGDACESGFMMKACIHPAQAEIVRAAFRPTAEQVAWAGRVLDAVGSGGVATVDGRMVDVPLVRQAEQIVRRQGVR